MPLTSKTSNISAKGLRDDVKPQADFADRVVPLHDRYWQTEAAMAEGNPVQALERGEQVTLPPVLYLQGGHDMSHPRPDLERFVMHYRRAGGQLELGLYEDAAEGFITRHPTSPAAQQGLEQLIEFVHKQLC